MSHPSAERQVYGAAFWSYAGAFAERGLRFAVFVVIARFTLPAEFGIVVLAVLIVGLLQELAQLGIGEALVRQKHVDHLTYDSAFWMLTGAALLVTLLYIGGVLLFVSRQGSPLLRDVLLAVSPALLIHSLGSVHQAHLLRDLGFRQLTMRIVGASLASGAIAILLAFAGWGIWALAAKAMLQAVFQTLLLWHFCSWRPQLRFSIGSLRPVLPDSVRLLGSSALHQLNQKGFDFAAGILLGGAALAILRVAGQTVFVLIELTVGPMTMAAFAILARHPDDPETGRQTFALLARSTALLVYPAFFGLAAISDILLPYLFGPQWTQAAAFVRLLALLAIPVHIQLLLTAAFFAAGRTDRILHWQLATSVATIACIAVGTPFGLWGLAMAAVAHLYLLIPLGLRWLHHDTFFSIRDVARNILPSVLGAAVMTVVVLAARFLLIEQLEVPILLAALMSLGAVFLGGATLIIAPDIVRSAVETVRQKLRRT